MGKKKKLEKQEKLKKEKKAARPKSAEKNKKTDKEKKADRGKDTDRRKNTDRRKTQEMSDGTVSAAGAKAAVSSDTAVLGVPPQKAAAGKSQLSQETDLDMGEIYRALGDNTRMQIIALLREQELCACELLKSVSVVQSTLSHHMKILADAGVVKCRKQGRWSYYSLNRSVLAAAAGYILDL